MTQPIPLQPASLDIWDKKYRLKDKHGTPIDQTIDDTFKRVAHALALVEKTPEKVAKWEEKFLWAMRNGAIPAGRIMSNAGAEEYKPATSLINCLGTGTPVLTSDGIVPIETLVGKKVKVLNGHGKWSEVEFKSYGKQKTYKVRFSEATRRKENGITIRATKGHRWVLKNGKVITTEYWLTGQTNNRHTVLPNILAPRPARGAGDYKEGVVHGMIYGDGHKVTGSNNHFCLDLVDKKTALKAWPEEFFGKQGLPTTYNKEGSSGLRWNFTSDKNWKTLPENPSKEYLLGFFAGLLATDGTVNKGKNGPKKRSTYIAIFGREELIRYLAKMLPVVGLVPQTGTLSLIKGTINNFGKRKQNVWRLAINPATVDIEDILRPEHKGNFFIGEKTQFFGQRWSLESIDPEGGEEEVFCCEEKETQSFALTTGLLTGNCVVSETIPDNMKGIMNRLTDAALTLKNGSGIGYCWSTLRPKGGYVAGSGSYTSGPLSFMDIYDKMCLTISSAGARRGAQMGTFDVSHPDVVDFIKAKRENGRLRQFNLSLLITKDFIEAVKNDQEWPLVFPVHQKEASEIDLNDPSKVIWKKWETNDHYIVNEQGLTACKIYKTIRAKHLWNMIMVSTYDYAEPGFLLIDKTNEMNNNWWCENIRASNPCVTGETRLATQYGMVKIKDLVESKLPLLTTVDNRAIELGDKGVTVRPAVPAFLTAKNADIFKITTKDGFEIRATKWHKFYTERGKFELKDLKIGDELWLQSGEGQFGSQGSYELGVLMGFVAGDGHFSTNPSKRKNLSTGKMEPTLNSKVNIGLWGEDCWESADKLALFANRIIKQHKEMLGYAGESIHQYLIKPNIITCIKHLTTEKSGFGSEMLAKVFNHYGMTTETKLKVPETVWQGNKECVIGYLQGLFQADGTVMKGKETSDARLNSSTPSLLKDVQKLLINFGVISRIYLRRNPCEKLMPDGKGGQKLYHCQANYELIIGGVSRHLFAKKIGFFGENKNCKLNNICQTIKKPHEQKYISRIISIEPDGVEDVYCTTQNDKNTIIFNGIASGNCGEQMLAPANSCIGPNARVNSNLGLIKISDAHRRALNGEKFKIAVEHHFSENRSDFRPATIVKTGKKELFEVKFKNGQRTELTKDHRIHTVEGWKQLKELTVGSRVHQQSHSLSNLYLCNDFMRGFIKTMANSSTTENDSAILNKSDILIKLFETMLLPYKTGARTITVNTNHPAIKEIAKYKELTSQAYSRGVLLAAKAVREKYFQGNECACGNLAFIKDVSDAFKQFGVYTKTSLFDDEAGRVIWHKGEKVVEELEIKAESELYNKSTHDLNLDMQSAMYGWLMCSGSVNGLVALTVPEKQKAGGELIAKELISLNGERTIPLYRTQNSRGETLTYRTENFELLQKIQTRLGLDDYSRHNRKIPEYIMGGTPEQQRSFLASIFSCSASMFGVSEKQKEEKNEKTDGEKAWIGMSSASERWLIDIQLILMNFGINTHISHTIPTNKKKKPFFLLRMASYNFYHFYRYIGFAFCEDKQAKLLACLRVKKSNRLAESLFLNNGDFCTTEIASIKSLGVQEVYDIEEPSTNTLIVDGIVIHNCLLGSVNLAPFVEQPFTDKAKFDNQKYKKIVGIFTRMLDNVADINGLPLPKQRSEMALKRRHGMGFLGLGSTLAMLGMKYGSPEAVDFTEQVTKDMAITGWESALELAQEKGPAPIMTEEFSITQEMLNQRPEMATDGVKVGDKLPGRVLHAKYSRYMQQIASADPELVEELAKIGARFTHHSSIAPTGTISLSFGNNVSNGIEPSFAHHYSRNIIREGKKSKEKVDVYSFESLAYKELVNPSVDLSLPLGSSPEALPACFVTSDSITPTQHVDMQAASQKWIDSSISKTANVPTDYPFEKFKDIYMYAYEKGLKGCTTFRFNPEVFQGVLVKEEDLANTTYEFTLKDGSKVAVKGNEMIEYDGETHTAANLYDALKEGFYGRY